MLVGIIVEGGATADGGDDVGIFAPRGSATFVLTAGRRGSDELDRALQSRSTL